ncbi:MAG TPA: hypothetical protein VF618_09045 [Thermoanaerobaculia bacterium]
MDADELQRRISDALRERADEVRTPGYSDYAVGADDLTAELMEAARATGVEGALETFERLRASHDGRRLRRALMEFVTHDPAAVALGLRIPSLEERAPWKVLPSKREKS